MIGVGMLCVVICWVMLVGVGVFVLVGVVFKDKGIEMLLDVVVDYLLLLLDCLVVSVESDEGEVVFLLDLDGLLVGLLFKIIY